MSHCGSSREPACSLDSAAGEALRRRVSAAAALLPVSGSVALRLRARIQRQKQDLRHSTVVSSSVLSLSLLFDDSAVMLVLILVRASRAACLHAVTCTCTNVASPCILALAPACGDVATGLPAGSHNNMALTSLSAAPQSSAPLAQLSGCRRSELNPEISS